MGLESLLLALRVATHESTRGRDYESTEWRVGLERHRPVVGAAFRTGVERVGRCHSHRPGRPHTLHHHAAPWNPFSDNRLNPRRNTPGPHSNLDSHALSHRQFVGLVLDHCGIDDRCGGRVRQEVECVRRRYAKSDRLREARRCHTIRLPQPDWPFTRSRQRPELPICAPFRLIVPASHPDQHPVAGCGFGDRQRSTQRR
jgi:hypothetical protein